MRPLARWGVRHCLAVPGIWLRVLAGALFGQSALGKLLRHRYHASWPASPRDPAHPMGTRLAPTCQRCWRATPARAIGLPLASGRDSR